MAEDQWVTLGKSTFLGKSSEPTEVEKQKQQIEVTNETLVKASVFRVHISFSKRMLSEIAFEM